MTSTSAAPSTDDNAPVTIATFPNPYEADLAHAALESQGIVAVVNNDHGQYMSAASWVQLQVARRDSAAATGLLERGPLHATRGADEADDMRPLRLKRRITLARWFLYAGALSFLAGWLLPFSVVALGLALWSRKNPRRAFGLAFGLQTVVVFAAIATSGLPGLIALIPLFAFYFAWTCAAPEPPERFLASPFPSMPAIDIGESWKVGDASREPAERPTWIVRVLGLFLLVLVVIWVLSLAVRAG